MIVQRDRFSNLVKVRVQVKFIYSTLALVLQQLHLMCKVHPLMDHITKLTKLANKVRTTNKQTEIDEMFCAIIGTVCSEVIAGTCDCGSHTVIGVQTQLIILVPMQTDIAES